MSGLILDNRRLKFTFSPFKLFIYAHEIPKIFAHTEAVFAIIQIKHRHLVMHK